MTRHDKEFSRPFFTYQTVSFSLSYVIISDNPLIRYLHFNISFPIVTSFTSYSTRENPLLNGNYLF